MLDEPLIEDRNEAGMKIYAAIIGKRPTIDPSLKSEIGSRAIRHRVKAIDASQPFPEISLRGRIEHWAGSMLDSLDQARARVASARVKEKLIVQPTRVKPVILVGTSIKKVQRAKEAA